MPLGGRKKPTRSNPAQDRDTSLDNPSADAQQMDPTENSPAVDVPKEDVPEDTAMLEPSEPTMDAEERPAAHGDAQEQQKRDVLDADDPPAAQRVDSDASHAPDSLSNTPGATQATLPSSPVVIPATPTATTATTPPPATSLRSSRHAAPAERTAQGLPTQGRSVSSQPKATPTHTAPKKGGKITASFLDASREAMECLERRAELCADFLRRVDDAAADLRARTRDPTVHRMLNELATLVGKAGRSILAGQDTMQTGSLQVAAAPKAAATTYAQTARNAAATTYAQTARSAAAPPKGRAPALPSKPGMNKDRRVFVRLSENSPFRQMSPHEVRRRVESVLPNSCSLAEVQRTPTGVAIVPRVGQDFAAYAADIARALGANTAETADPWYHFYLPGVPQRLRGLATDGCSLALRDVGEEELREELVRAFGVGPKKFYRVPETQHRDSAPLVACFSKAELLLAPKEVTIFCMRVRVIDRTRRPRVGQCQRCWAFHREEHCTNRPRCGTCASTMHTSADHTPACGTESCQCPPRCANCNGPHPSAYPDCPLRPRRCRATGSIQRVGKDQISQIRTGMKARWNKVAARCPCRDGRRPSLEAQATQPQTSQPSQGVRSQPQQGMQGSRVPQTGNPYTPLETSDPTEITHPDRQGQAQVLLVNRDSAWADDSATQPQSW